jgi:hypothetical protein
MLENGSGERWYRLAGRELTTAIGSRYLSPFEISPPEQPPTIEKLAPSGVAHNVVRRTTGWVAGEDRAVECRAENDGLRVWVERVGTFAVTWGGRSVCCVEEAPEMDPEVLEQIALGPPPILALALQQVICLHAGGVATEGGVVAFLGRSGAGKSTLAEFLDRREPGWSRCADDILALEGGEGGVEALPQFPQLKLDRDQQWRPPKPERLPMRAFYVLGEELPEASKPVVTALSPREATAELVSHTVAWTLFPPDLLRRHLELCASAAGAVPVRELSYPKRIELLPEVAETIRADLERSRA